MPKAPKPKKPRTRGQRIRRRIRVGGVIALLLGVVAVVLLTVYVGNRALIAKDQLQAAQGRLTTFKSALGQPGAPSTAKLYAQLQANTSKAATQVDDPVWSAYEHIPLLGPNLIAFRQTTTLVNGLVHDGVGPLAKAADGISVDSLKPKNGGIDIEPLKTLTPAVAQADDAITTADRRAAAIDTRHVVPQLKQPITQLQSLLEQAMPVTHELRKVMPVLYPALGGNGARHYILLFQNNAEERASGGAPNAMAELVVNHGRIKLGRQPSTSTFPQFPQPGVLEFGGDWDKLFGYKVTTKINQTTFVPDFPTTAKIARTMWRKTYPGKVDGVISFDPVALSYLLRATGPVKLATGDQLDSDNAVRFLLSDVYARYTNPLVQDAVFASAADSIFKAVTSGQGDPAQYVKQLTPMMQEQRLKMWSVRDDEEKLLLTSPLGNMLPEDNSKGTVIGVYNNDDSTSKMSFYMQNTVGVSVDRCQATPKYTVTTKVTDTLKPSQIAGLTSYVLAAQPRIVAGGDRQWVNVYGPAGSKLVAMYIDGVKVRWGTSWTPQVNTVLDATGMDDLRPAVKGELWDRPLGIVSIKMGPLESRTVKAVFSGGKGQPSTPVSVSHTPRVWPVPVDITTKKCG